MKIRPFPLFRVLTTQFRDGSSVIAGARRSRAYVRGGVACIGVGAIAITPYFHPSSWFTGSKKGPETYQHVSEVGPGSTPQTLMSRAYGAIGYARSSPAGVLEKETKPDSGEQRSWTYIIRDMITGTVTVVSPLIATLYSWLTGGVWKRNTEPDNGEQRSWTYIIRGMTTRAWNFVSYSIPLIYSGFTGVVKKLQTLLYRDSDEIAKGNGDGKAEKITEPDNGTRNYKFLIGSVIGGVGAVAIASVVLPAIGFTSGGIAAGSFAAKLMSMCAIANGGGVAAGSTVAVSQSAGVLGLATKTKVIIWAAGSAVGVIVSVLIKNED